MWISRKDYEGLRSMIDEEKKISGGYWTRLNKAESELEDLKRSLMPIKHYQVIDTKSGLRYDVNAVDYRYAGDGYNGDERVEFRSADCSVVLRIHKNVSIQVVEEE